MTSVKPAKALEDVECEDVWRWRIRRIGIAYFAIIEESLTRDFPWSVTMLPGIRARKHVARESECVLGG